MGDGLYDCAPYAYQLSILATTPVHTQTLVVRIVVGERPRIADDTHNRAALAKSRF